MRTKLFKLRSFLAILACLALLFWGASCIYEKKTRFGLLSKFSSPTFSASPEWELPPLAREEQKQIDAILSQKFTYLARGSQAFAFISEDKNYILKCFKQHKWHPKNILGYMPISWNPYYRDYLGRKQKQYGVLSSCKTALTYVKEDTGIIFSHLNPTPLAVASVTLVDKHGKTWSLDLSKSCFLLQKKADLFYPHIDALMQKGDVEEAKYAISSTFKLLKRFLEKGVFDNNTILRKNFGFIGREAIQFDIGKFKCDPMKKRDPQEIGVITQSFYTWIKKTYPELLPHFDAELAEVTRVGL